MIARSFLIALLVAVTTAVQATNRGYWDLWALDVAMICFAQNPAYRNTPLGNMIIKGDFTNWKAFEQRPSTVCLRSKKWVSDRFCAEVTALDEKTFRDLDPLRKKHELELQELQDVILYQYKSREPNGASLPCPGSK